MSAVRTASAAAFPSRSRLSVETATTSTFADAVLARRIAVPSPALAKQAPVSAAPVRSSATIASCGMALVRRRCGTGITGARHLERDVDGGQQARLLRDPFPGDIKGRTVVDRGADDRQAIADIDP